MKKRNNLVLISLLVGITVLGILFFLCFSKSKKNKSTVIAFYNLPEEYKVAVENVICGTTKNNYKFVDVTEEEILSSKFTSKYQMLFSYNDANTYELMSKAVTLPDDVIAKIPSTIKTSSLYTLEDQVKIMPIAIDYFETAILKTAVSKYEIPVPESISEILKFARTSKFYYPIPIIISGAEDDNVNSLLTLFVGAYGGKAGYENVISELKKLNDFSDLYEIRIGGDAAPDLKISDLLDIIKNWQSNGYLPAEWTRLTSKQTESLIDDNRIDMCFMNLSEHRTKRTPNIYYYTTIPFPNETSKHNISVQPVVVGMSFYDKEETRLAFNRLSLESSQEYISLKTRIGPAMLRGTSFDVQADDARYIAASTEGGPVPDLGTAAFKTKEKRHQMAEAIRNYFE